MCMKTINGFGFSQAEAGCRETRVLLIKKVPKLRLNGNHSNKRHLCESNMSFCML